MTHAKSMFKRAFAAASVVVLAFAVLTSGLSAALPAYAEESEPEHVWVGSDEIKGDLYLPNKSVTVASGHVDAFYAFQTSADSKLKMGFSYGNVIYNPKNVTMTVDNSSYYTENLHYKNASNIPFDASKGYWRLNGSGNKQSSEVFPGWDSSNSRFSVGVKDSVNACADIVIDKITGPKGGRVLAWTQKTDSSNATFAKSLEAHDKDDENTAGSRFVMPGIIHQSMVGHEHADWVFTKPGTYKISAYTIVKNKESGKTVTSEHATYTFNVKPNATHAVESETETLQMNPNRVPPTKDPKFVEESLSGSTHCKEDDSNICIVGVRNTGSHPHYHSYEPGGEVTLSVYLPKSVRGKGNTTPSWTYIREDEMGSDFVYDFTNNPPVGDREPDFKKTFTIPAEPALNGMLVNATISSGTELGLGYGDDRDTVRIAVDDHGADGRPVVAAIGKLKPLEVGDTLNLRSVLYSPRVSVINNEKQDPDVQVTSIVKRHVWLIKKAGETKFKYLPKEEGRNLNLKIDESMDGAIIRSSLVLDNGELYRNEEFNDFADYQIWLKSSEKKPSDKKPADKKPSEENSSEDGSAEDGSAEDNSSEDNDGKKNSDKKDRKRNRKKNSKNRKNSKNNKAKKNNKGKNLKKNKKNKNNKKNKKHKKNKNNKAEKDASEDEESENEKSEEDASGESDNESASNSENASDNANGVINNGNNNQSGENEDNSKNSGTEQNNLQKPASTPLAASAQTNSGFANRGGGLAHKSSRRLGGLKRSKSYAKRSKKLKKVKLLGKKRKKSAKSASYESDENNGDVDASGTANNTEDAEEVFDEAESTEEKSHKTKWVTAAVGTAGVSLCTLTGVGVCLLKSRMKLL